MAVSIDSDVSNGSQGHKVQRQNCRLLGFSGSDSSKEGKHGGAEAWTGVKSWLGWAGDRTVSGNGLCTPRDGSRSLPSPRESNLPRSPGTSGP